MVPGTQGGVAGGVKGSSCECSGSLSASMGLWISLEEHPWPNSL